MNKVPDLLRDAADIYEQRNKLYKDNYKSFGNWAALLLKDVKPVTSLDHSRMALFNQILYKISRYVQQFHDGGHSDSLTDLSVYAMMLREVDEGPVPDPLDYTSDHTLFPKRDIIIKNEKPPGDTFNLTVDNELFESLMNGKALIGLKPGTGVYIATVPEVPSLDPTALGAGGKRGTGLFDGDGKSSVAMDPPPSPPSLCTCGHLRGVHRWGLSQKDMSALPAMSCNQCKQPDECQQRLTCHRRVYTFPRNSHHECADQECDCKEFNEAKT